MLLITLLLLTTGLAAAQATEEPVVFVSNLDTTLTFTAEVTVSDMHVFLDGVLLKQFPAIAKGATETVTTPLNGEHEVEVRFLREHAYVWERPEVTLNDRPGILKYVEYDKDKDRVEFSITGADFVHPNNLDTTADNSNEPFTGFNATLNSNRELYCYPRITTGKNLFFSCKSPDYANKLDLAMTIGVKEVTMINVTASETIIEEPEEESTTSATQLPPTPPIPPVIIPEEDTIPRADNITMTDIYKESSIPIPITIFIILMFLAVMTIMFIASHHKHESKQAGTHHPLKKK